jgi:hypothetical protein
VVLSDPELASNLAADSILCDPYGMLVRLHEKVAQEYSKREWVLARCEAEKQRVQQGLDGLKGTDSVMEALPSLQPLFEGLTGMVAVAGLRPPTHRRGLIVMREVLEGVGKVELIAETLEFFGFDDLSRREVDDNLRMCAEAFDKAVAVSRTPVLGSFKLQEHVRPYVVDGTQEMIDDGFHREAMYWVLAFMVISNGAIEVDAPEKEKGVYRENFERLLNDIGWWTHADLERREGQARSLADKVFQAAEEIVA